MFIHITPGMLEVDIGVHFFTEEHNGIFHNILKTYADVLLGVHAAHSHMDSFKMIYKDGEYNEVLHHSSYGIVSDNICHSNLVNISGASMNFSTVDFVHCD